MELFFSESSIGNLTELRAKLEGTRFAVLRGSS